MEGADEAERFQAEGQGAFDPMTLGGLAPARDEQGFLQRAEAFPDFPAVLGRSRVLGWDPAPPENDQGGRQGRDGFGDLHILSTDSTHFRP